MASQGEANKAAERSSIDSGVKYETVSVRNEVEELQELLRINGAALATKINEKLDLEDKIAALTEELNTLRSTPKGEPASGFEEWWKPQVEAAEVEPSPEEEGFARAAWDAAIRTVDDEKAFFAGFDAGAAFSSVQAVSEDADKQDGNQKGAAISVRECANALCRDLPEGWVVNLHMEQHSGFFELFDHGIEVPLECFTSIDAKLEEQVRDALQYAVVNTYRGFPDALDAHPAQSTPQSAPEEK